jgi:hypothetical protein
MTKRGQIREVLAAGPMTAGDVIEKSGLASKDVGLALYQMTNEGKLKRKGDGLTAVFTLVADKPPRHIHKRKSKKKEPTVRKVAAPVSDFLPAITVDQRLVMIRDGSHSILSVEDTLSVADLVLQQFKVE